MRKQTFVGILIVVISMILLLAVLIYQIPQELPPDIPAPSISPEEITQNPVLIATTSINRQTESGLEIYDSDSGARYQISQENAEYHLLLDNMTIVIQSIRYQKKCSRPYEEFQMIKSNYRYVALIQDDNISGRYCYNSGNCKNITADEFTILLKKKTGEGIETGCLESGLIFAYNNRTDAGIWSLAEENYGYMENLTGNVQTIIDSGKIDSGYRNLGAIVTPVQTPSCHSNLPLVPAGGNVWLGERCLDLSSVVSSGQVISWYKNGRNVENTTPDISRIVYDSQNFSVNPDEFLGFEGNWYLGNTDKIAFVVRVPILDTNSTSAN